MSLRSTSHSAPYTGGINARLIACVNESGASVPIYSIVAASGGYTKPNSDSPREYMQVDYPVADGEDALFVTCGKVMADASPGKYGHCWSVLSGPLWVNYEGDVPVLGDTVGPVEDSFNVSKNGAGFKVLQVDATNTRVRVIIPTGPCAYYHEFEVRGGLPTEGSQIWSYTIDADTQDVTVDFDMTPAQLKTHLLAQFSGLASADLDTFDGPHPEVSLIVKWKGDAVADVSAGYPPTVGTNSMNNSAWGHVHQINPRV